MKLDPRTTGLLEAFERATSIASAYSTSGDVEADNARYLLHGGQGTSPAYEAWRQARAAEQAKGKSTLAVVTVERDDLGGRERWIAQIDGPHEWLENATAAPTPLEAVRQLLNYDANRRRRVYELTHDGARLEINYPFQALIRGDWCDPLRVWRTVERFCALNTDRRQVAPDERVTPFRFVHLACGYRCTGFVQPDAFVELALSRRGSAGTAVCTHGVGLFFDTYFAASALEEMAEAGQLEESHFRAFHALIRGADEAQKEGKLCPRCRSDVLTVNTRTMDGRPEARVCLDCMDGRPKKPRVIPGPPKTGLEGIEPFKGGQITINQQHKLPESSLLALGELLRAGGTSVEQIVDDVVAMVQDAKVIPGVQAARERGLAAHDPALDGAGRPIVLRPASEDARFQDAPTEAVEPLTTGPAGQRWVTFRGVHNSRVVVDGAPIHVGADQTYTFQIGTHARIDVDSGLVRMSEEGKAERLLGPHGDTLDPEDDDEDAEIADEERYAFDDL